MVAALGRIENSRDISGTYKPSSKSDIWLFVNGVRLYANAKGLTSFNYDAVQKTGGTLQGKWKLYLVDAFSASNTSSRVPGTVGNWSIKISYNPVGGSCAIKKKFIGKKKQRKLQLTLQGCSKKTKIQRFTGRKWANFVSPFALPKGKTLQYRAIDTTSGAVLVEGVA